MLTNGLLIRLQILPQDESFVICIHSIKSRCTTCCTNTLKLYLPKELVGCIAIHPSSRRTVIRGAYSQSYVHQSINIRFLCCNVPSLFLRSDKGELEQARWRVRCRRGNRHRCLHERSGGEANSDRRPRDDFLRRLDYRQLQFPSVHKENPGRIWRAFRVLIDNLHVLSHPASQASFLAGFIVTVYRLWWHPQGCSRLYPYNNVAACP